MIKDDVLRLLTEVKPLPGEKMCIVPAAREDFERFESFHTVRLPLELKSWLSVCNGAAVNPGGLDSLFGDGRKVSLDWHFKRFPELKRRGWFPVASDGSGDIYILASHLKLPTTGTHPVCFVDQTDFGAIAYAVASGLWKFLYMLLENEVFHDRGQEVYWPFNRDAVLARDPDLLSLRGVPLPWEVDNARS